MEELKINSKFNLINTLEYLASKEDQITYKAEVPFVHIPYELICQWDGHFIKTEKWFKAIWTQKEWIALNDFDIEFNQICKEIPNNGYDDIPEVLTQPLWCKIVEKAQIALHKINE